MKYKDKDFCVCGHSAECHDWNYVGNLLFKYKNYQGCSAFLGQSGYFSETYCECKKFKLDNLKYVENLYNESATKL